MVNLLLADDDELLTAPGIVKTMLDPACGTGGMLSVSEEYLRNLNPQGRLHVYGQEVNAETYATCRSDMLIKGLDASRIRFGNSFDNDQHPNRRFDYLLANPPFGVEWKMVANHIRGEHKTKGFAGRFGAGLPRINDGSFLFLQHMISKMKRPEDGGARLAIVFNGSPLFTGAAGSGESEIRRWIIENDWLEAVVALPDQLFYNTGISTYFWVVTNRKSPKRRGKIQLIDARESWTKMRKSLGNKRKQISDDQIAELTRLYGAFEEGPRSKIFPNESFGFLRITVERPLRLRWEITDDTLAAVAADKKVTKLLSTRKDLLLDKLRANHGATYPTEKDAKAAVRDALVSVIGEKPTPLVNAVTSRSRGARPRRPGRHRPKGQPQTRPHPPRPRERPPTRQTSHPRSRHQPAARHHRIPDRRQRLPRNRSPPLRPRRLARPHQNQDRLRNPPHPPLLHLHPTPPPPRNRQRNQHPRSRSPIPPRRGHRLNWTEVPLWSLYRRVDGSGRPDLPLLSVYRDHGVVLREGREDNYNRPGADLSRYKIVRKGDLVINKMKTWQGSLGVSAFDGIVSPAYFVAQRVGHVDDRFMHHLLRSQPLIAEYAARSKGIRPAQWDLPWGEFASIKVHLPHIGTQRAIADYLDTETSRIDTLIAKKRRMITLLEERWNRLRSRETLCGLDPVRGGGLAQQWEELNLGVLIRLQRGHDLPHEDRIAGDVPVVSSGGVSGSHDTAIADGPGVVTGRYGTVGEVFFIDGPYWPLNTTLYVKDFRANHPRWVYHLLASIPLDIDAQKSAVGGINRNAVGSLRVPRPPFLAQQTIASDLDKAQAVSEQSRRALEAQIDLLAERRQALITAAVTGELPVPAIAACRQSAHT